MIGTKSLMRIECHSLDCLLAFLRKLFPVLSEHDTMLYLFRTDTSLQEAVSRALSGHHMLSTYQDAYKAAADAACQIAILPSILPSLQGVSCTLTSSDVEHISITSYFSFKSWPGKSICVPKLAPICL